MTDKEAIAFWNLMMVSDPWPLSETYHDIMWQLADKEAIKRGYDSWIVAYHEFRKVVND